MSKYYADGNKRHRMGPRAWARCKRQWFRRQKGIIAAGPAFAYGSWHEPLFHNGGKP